MQQASFLQDTPQRVACQSSGPSGVPLERWKLCLHSCQPNQPKSSSGVSQSQLDQDAPLSPPHRRILMPRTCHLQPTLSSVSRFLRFSECKNDSHVLLPSLQHVWQDQPLRVIKLCACQLESYLTCEAQWLKSDDVSCEGCVACQFARVCLSHAVCFRVDHLASDQAPRLCQRASVHCEQAISKETHQRNSAETVLCLASRQASAKASPYDHTQSKDSCEEPKSLRRDAADYKHTPTRFQYLVS